MVRRSMDLIGAQLRIQEANLGLASVMHDRLITQIADFEQGLGPDEELGGYLASFGREILVRVAEIGYHNPYFLVFHGEEVTTGARVKLVQHVSQISVLLTAVPKPAERERPRRIGFQQIGSDE